MEIDRMPKKSPFDLSGLFSIMQNLQWSCCLTKTIRVEHNTLSSPNHALSPSLSIPVTHTSEYSTQIIGSPVIAIKKAFAVGQGNNLKMLTKV